jgi:hypothetical protein
VTDGDRLRSAKAALLGFHGQRSTGDDAMACAIGWWLYEHKGVSRFVIPAEQRDLPILPEPLEVSAPLPWLRRGRYRADWRWRLCVSRSQIVLLAGGANLHENIDFDRFKRLARLARKTGSLVLGAIGMSLGPFKTQKKIDECGEFLAMLDFATVRDHTSYELICDYALPYKPVQALDAVLTLPEVFAIPATPKTALKTDVLDVGVSICEYHQLVVSGQSEGKGREVKVADALLAFSHDHRIRVNLLEFSGHPIRGDAPIVDALASALEGRCEVVVHRYSLDPSRMWKTVSAMDLMVAMRYHSSIFSYSAGIPFVMLNYHPKCTAFADDVGLPAELVLSAYDFTAEDLTSRLELLADPGRPQPAVQWRQAADRAEANFGPLEHII